MPKRSRRRLKKRYQKRRQYQPPPLLKVQTPTPKETTQTTPDGSLAPLTYPPKLLKKDLLKTFIITCLIILTQVWLYWLDRNGYLANILNRWGW